MSKVTTLRLTFPTLAKRFKFWCRATAMLFTGKIRVAFVASALRNFGDPVWHKTESDSSATKLQIRFVQGDGRSSKHPTRLQVKQSPSKLGVCLTFLRVHREKPNVYCVVPHKGEAELLIKEFPNLKFLTLNAATTGWSDLDPDAYLCCTRMLDPVRALQLAHRIRYPNRENQVLVYGYDDKPVTHPKFK